MVTATQTYPSVVDQLVEQLFQRILNGDYPPGSKVTETGLAEQLGASRTPIREAIRRLHELGLIVVRPRCGLEIASVDERDVEEIGALRAELETFAIRLAVPRADKDALERLERIQQRCETLLDNGGRLEVFREDSRFHLAIAELSGNRYLYDALERLDAKVVLCRMMLCRSADKIRNTVGFHRTILRAMRAHDTDRAVQALRDHIENTQL